MMADHSCLICGITEAEVVAVRRRDGYTLGCGIESNTEHGFDYEELSPRHRWAPWSDRELGRMGLKPEVFDRYRTTIEAGIRYAPCADTKRGHFYPTPSDADAFGMPIDRCWGCGALESAVPRTTEHTEGGL
jgi:hypothetical protein